MKVIYTDQSYERLEESMNFLLEVQGLPLDKVREIGSKLLDRADSLANSPNIGQYEEYLKHLGKGHRRLVEGVFKIIYRIKGDYIFIIDFFDTRQNPDKMKG